MKRKYRITAEKGETFRMFHPNGYWIGPELGDFTSIATAMNWLEKYLERLARWEASS